jgi:hypothetical protein
MYKGLAYPKRLLFMRITCFFLLVIIAILEIGPIPLTPLVLIWVVLFRPLWFYELVLKIYGKK